MTSLNILWHETDHTIGFFSDKNASKNGIIVKVDCQKVIRVGDLIIGCYGASHWLDRICKSYVKNGRLSTVDDFVSIGILEEAFKINFSEYDGMISVVFIAGNSVKLGNKLVVRKWEIHNKEISYIAARHGVLYPPLYKNRNKLNRNLASGDLREYNHHIVQLQRDEYPECNIGDQIDELILKKETG